MLYICIKQILIQLFIITESNFDEEEQVYCLRCVRGFITKGDPTKPFVDARRVHRSFNCVQCGERFNPSNNLKHDLLKHTREKSFSCDQCSRRFAQKIT